MRRALRRETNPWGAVRKRAQRRLGDAASKCVAEMLEQRLLLSQSPLVVQGSAADDAFLVRVDAASDLVVVYPDLAGLLQPIANAPVDSVSTIEIHGHGGLNRILIDTSAGNPIPSSGLLVDGSEGQNALTIQGDSTANVRLINGSQLSSLTLKAGSLTVGTDLSAGKNDTVVEVQGGALVLNSTQHLMSLHVGNLGAVVLSAGGLKLIRVGDLALSTGARLDLGDNALVLQAQPGQVSPTLTAVGALIRSAYATSPRWSGPGITSSSAARASVTGLAAIANDRGGGRLLFTNYRGESVDANSILVQFAWNGDINLDGRINADDYFRIDAGFLTHSHGYYNGDLNYDAVINADDYFLIDSAFLSQGPLPHITAGLAHDSGSPGDGLTNDPSILGTISHLERTAMLQLGVDGVPPSSYTDVLPSVAADGSFNLSRAVLESVLGGSLADGPHIVRLRAVDRFGPILDSLDIPFVLDATAPGVPSFSFDPAYDTAPVGDGITTSLKTALIGTAEALTTVTLSTTGAITVAASNGSFRLPYVPLALGKNEITIRAVDAAGNTSTTITHSITRIAPAGSNQVVLDWDKAALDAVVLDASTPPWASRNLAIVTSSMYDAVNSITKASSSLYVTLAAPAGASVEAAVASAAHRALSDLYPAQTAIFDVRLSQSLSSIPDGQAKTDGIALGRAIADAILAQRADDGSRDFVDYQPVSGPGQWQPTYPGFAPALLPNWATLTPFSMNSPDQFRPAGPPSLDSAQWQADYSQVMSVGKATSSTRTSDQTQVARFWADGAGTVTPAGHWNLIATQLLAEQGNASLADTARLLAELNVAQADATIIAWDAKYAENFWRPVTAIQEGGGNASLVADPNWVPLLITPNFPEYVSGHSTYSGAAAVILSSFFGDSLAFSTTSPSPGVAGVVRSYSSFDQAAQEAGMSRIFAGIHFNSAVQDGLTAGKALGQFVLQKFTDQTDTRPPFVHFTSTVKTTSGPFTLAGNVTDNVSGVYSLKAQIDAGQEFAVSFNGSGAFGIPINVTGNGPHVVHIKATDGAGNVSGGIDYSFTLDSLLPTVTITSPQAGSSLKIDSRLVGTASGTGSALISLSYRLDDSAAIPLPVGETGSFDEGLDLSGLAPGNHSVRVSAIDAAGNSAGTSVSFKIDAPLPLTILDADPANGAVDVGSTFRPKVVFSRPIDPATLNSDNFFLSHGGQKLAATIVPAAHGQWAWLFAADPLPGAAAITLTVDGNSIKSPDGVVLDADQNGTPGGIFQLQFSTVSLVMIPNTSLSGIVADPGPDLTPGTPDDVRAGPDGVLMTADDIYLHPIAGVTLGIIGMNLSVVSGADGKFNFPSVPVGDIKLDADGNTATNAPEGIYFPSMVMDLVIEPGRANTVMQAMKTHANITSDEPGMYLPRVRKSILTTIAPTGMTGIGVGAVSAPNLTDQQRQHLVLQVQGGSVLGPDGQPLANPQVGISTVPPQLVMDMLPPGVLEHTFDITIQAPGAAVFNTPLQITFPNVFNAAPGSKLDFLSFDHTTGRLVIEGTATVSADGLSATTDPGMGITKPGWHGLTPPGGCGGSGGPPPPPPQESDDEKVTIHNPQSLNFITDRGGDSLFSKFWEADPANPNAPKLPPIPGCGVPPHAPDDAFLLENQQPFLNVTIEIDGPLAEFAKPENDTDLPLIGQSFTLSPGNTEKKTFSISSKTFEEMFGPNELGSLSQDQLYGAQITITELRQKADGTRTRDISTFYIYRWIDLGSERFTASPPGSAIFGKTLITPPAAAFVRTKNVAMHLPAKVPTEFVPTAKADNVVFKLPGAAGTGISTWTAVPKKVDNQGEFTIETGLPTARVQVGTLLPDIVGIAPTTISHNRAAFEGALLFIIDNLNESNGDDGEFGTDDDDIDYIFRFGETPEENGSIIRTSPRFRTDFAGFMPKDRQDPGPDNVLGTADDRFTPEQRQALEARVSAEGQKYADAFKAKFAKITAASGGFAAYNVIDDPAASDVAPVWQVDIGNFTDLAMVGFATLDISSDNLAALLDFVKDPKLSQTVKEQAFALRINHNVPGGVIGLNLAYTLSTKNISIGDIAANVAAHEVAHTFGAPNAWERNDKGQAVNLNPIPDVMNFSHNQIGILTFSPDTVRLLQAAMGIYPDGDFQLAAALKMFVENVKFQTNQEILAEQIIADPPEVPELAVLSGGSAFSPGRTFDFGVVEVGHSASTQFTLLNPTSVPLTISGFNLLSGDTGYSFSGVAAGTVIPAQGSTTLTVDFDSTTIGSFGDALTITSGGPVNSTYTINLQGKAVSTTPSARITVGQNNLGGAPLGQPRMESSVLTITNDGLAPLSISAIALGEGSEHFKLTGLPANLATTPIVLARGQSFSFGASFAPSKLGLVRGRVSITSNDPKQPVMQAGVVGTGTQRVAQFDWGNDFVAVTTQVGGRANTNRVRSDDLGHFDMFVAANAPYEIAIFDPQTGLVTHGFGATAGSGRGTDMTATLVFRGSTEPDTDMDGLPDDVEFAIGTSANRTDTDRDGLDDFVEIQQGLDPFGGRAFPTGVIANVALAGEAKEVVLEGSTLDPAGQLAYVATGSFGLAIVDASQFRKPIVLSQLGLAGDAVDVAVDSRLGIAAVAAGDGGLHLISVSNPSSPQLVQTITGTFTQVEVLDGIAYASSGSDLSAVDLATGQPIQNLAPSGDAITTLTREGSFLYALDRSLVLRAIDLSSGEMVARGSLALPDGGGKLFVGGGVAFVPGEELSGGITGGFVTVDVSNPNNLVLISGVDDAQIAGRAIVANGSGLAVSVGSTRTLREGVLELLDVSNPANTAGFLTRFDLPRDPLGVAIGAGIAFVADKSAGLVVVNYLPFDVSGLPPSVSISANVTDVDPATSGVQVFQGTTIKVTPTIADDTQVRNVELLVNGSAVRNDVSFPFDLAAIALGPAGVTTVQLRATDTGGNTALSNTLTFQLVPDRTPPTIVSITPADGSTGGAGLRRMTVTFSEPMDLAKLVAGNFTFVAASADGQFGTIDDAPVPFALQTRNDATSVQLTVAALAAGKYRLTIAAGALTDRAGNAITQPVVSSTFTLGALEPPSFGVLGVQPALGVGLQPAFVATGDVDGDGDMDLVTANQTSDSISVLLNDGKGGLKQRFDFAAGDGANALALGDLDGDGDADLVVANRNANTVSVLLNNGGGTFAAHVDFAVGASPRSVALGDVDGDGDLDFVSSNYSDGSLSILRNNGAGVFASRANVSAGGGPRSVALADVDGDGDRDLVAANASSNNVSVLRNSGTGTFGSPANVNVGTSPRSLAMGDVDGDGDVDIVTANFTSNNVSVLRNNGAGTFGTRVEITAPANPHSVILADVDGDGDRDIITANFSNNSASVLQNNGAGSFGARADFAVASTPQSVAVGDLDDDGDMDLATANYGSANVSLLSNDGSGLFGEPLIPVGTGPSAVKAGDLDGDGDLDAVTANATAGTVSIVLNMGTGSLASRADVAVGSTPKSVALADVDGDGDLDIITANYIGNSVSVLRNNGAGVFGSRVDFPVGSRPQAVALAKLDADGDLDIVTANADTTTILKNDGSGDFSARSDLGGFAPLNSTIAIGDIDADGDLDIVASLYILRNDGTGTFAPGPGTNGVGNRTALADLDGDGDLDIIGITSTNGGSLTLARNDGTGEFERITAGGANKEITLISFDLRAMTLGDVDGDGDLDIITANGNDNNISVILNDGTAHFGPPTDAPDTFVCTSLDYSVGTVPVGGPRALTLGDMDGDGDLDVIAANYSRNDVTVLRNDGGGGFGIPLIPLRTDKSSSTFPSARALATGDLNGDGKLDVVSNVEGIAIVLFGDGAGGFDQSDALGVAGRVLSAALGDVDRDGDLDLVVGSLNGGTTIGLNNGRGVFASTGANMFEITGGGGPVSVALADLDGDGKLDIVAAMNDTRAGGFVRVHIGNGDGSFAPPVGYSVAANPESVMLGDTDGDGDLDIVTANSAGSNVTILTNDGTAIFGSPRIPVESGPRAVAAGDVDGDGDLDLVVGCNYNLKGVVVLRNNGSKVLAVDPVSVSVGGSALSVTLGDLDGDGDLDVVTASIGEGFIARLLNDGTGRFGSRTDFAVGAQPRAVALGDVEGDGDLDIVAANSLGNTVSVLRNDGAANFGSRADFPVGNGPQWLALGDVDGDGDPDITTANRSSNDVSILRNDGTGAFGSRAEVTVGADPRFVALGDLDKDGDMDLVTANVGGNSVTRLLNDGAGAFGSRSDVTVASNPLSLAVGDVDGDGDLDVVTGNTSANNVTRLLNDGVGGLGTRADLALGASPAFLLLADIDGDGDKDLISANGGQVLPMVGTVNSVSVLHNNGTGAFDVRGPDLAVGTGPQSVSLADVNGDGRLDIVTANATANSVSVLLGAAAGGFTRADFIVGVTPRSLVLGDIDGDGDLDIVTANFGANGNSVSVLLNDSAGGFLTRLDLIVGSRPPRVVGLADVDGDGDLDIITASYDDNSVAVLIVAR